jgi:hypothetical protein
VYSAPQILPGSKAALFTNAPSVLSSAIDAVSLESGTVTRVVEVGCCAAYAASGHLVYAHPLSGTMFAVRFDPERLQVVGEPARVMDGLMSGVLNGGQFATSRSGSLVYLTNSAVNERAFVWVDRAGRTTAIDFEKRNYGHPATGYDLWTMTLDRERTVKPLLATPYNELAARFSPDGREPAAPRIRSVSAVRIQTAGACRRARSADNPDRRSRASQDPACDARRWHSRSPVPQSDPRRRS